MQIPRVELLEFHTLIFDFDGVFTDNFVFVNSAGEEFVRCSRSDSLGINLLKAANRLGIANLKSFVLTRETNSVVGARCRKMGLEYFPSVLDKLNFVDNYLQSINGKLTFGFSGVIYLGNDINDLQVMERVGLAIAPIDAHPLVREVAHLILPHRGGFGFVRHAIEHLLGFDGLSKEERNELISNC